MDYQNKWEPYQLNEKFWREVLEGRTIKTVNFSEDGIKSLTLDSGEEVFLEKTLFIQVEDAQVA